MKYQQTVKCCAVMPDDDISSYEYLPEEPITKEKYAELLAHIDNRMSEDIGKEHIDCEGGICAVGFNQTKGEIEKPGV